MSLVPLSNVHPGAIFSLMLLKMYDASASSLSFFSSSFSVKLSSNEVQEDVGSRLVFAVFSSFPENSW